ncbi:hypothetical protein D9611_005350 [Ephemerocybe angulata]|uniref:Uncharacterized protein n=1 Tax=Ephemerocybe angulata TaxID=980116 RepID=A0A8H5BZR7_9AGAR|nr:hypothetical protein D9611_005350 [Tulosesus angulatus]
MLSDTPATLVPIPVEKLVPGNSESPQMGMREAANRGLDLRLKQRQPSRCGRAVEEFPYFRVPPWPTSPSLSAAPLSLSPSGRQVDHDACSSSRLVQVVDALAASYAGSRRHGASYLGNTMVVSIERASMVMTPTPRDILQALESSGERRPPG